MWDEARAVPKSPQWTIKTSTCFWTRVLTQSFVWTGRHSHYNHWRTSSMYLSTCYYSCTGWRPDEQLSNFIKFSGFWNGFQAADILEFITSLAALQYYLPLSKFLTFRDLLDLDLVNQQPSQSKTYTFTHDLDLNFNLSDGEVPNKIK